MTKFLADGTGAVVGRFEPPATLEEIDQAICSSLELTEDQP